MIENTVFLKNQNKILELLALQKPLNVILDTITKTVEAQMVGVRCTILKANEEGTHLISGMTESLPGELQELLEYGVKISPKNGSCGSAAFFREPVVVDSIATSPLWGGKFREHTLTHGLLACWSTPVVNPNEKVLGTFAIYFPETRGPTDQEARLLSVAGHLAGLALEQERTRMERLLYNEHLEEKVHNRTRELEKAVEEAKQANNAKSVFLSRMSHELRTPMNAILGFGQLLKMDNDNLLNDSYQDSIDHILSAGDHLLTLINEVLDLAKIESGKFDLYPEVIDLGECLQEVMDITEPLAKEKQIEVNVFASEMKETRVQADRVRLKQILLNLVSNGIKYNKLGGGLTIGYQKKASGRVLVNIEDTGKGISEENIEKIFEPFHRLESGPNAVDGTGVGLTISRQLAELMGGHLSARSELGVGTCLSLELPAVE